MWSNHGQHLTHPKSCNGQEGGRQVVLNSREAVLRIQGDPWSNPPCLLSCFQVMCRPAVRWWLQPPSWAYRPFSCCWRFSPASEWAMSLAWPSTGGLSWLVLCSFCWVRQLSVWCPILSKPDECQLLLLLHPAQETCERKPSESSVE